ncbi:hypothetical protein KY366_00250 [Candidatus Woesearchaeota archaeon]|nr:hypothetical protein [Candidatus Woesearchaeota archaeon]
MPKRTTHEHIAELLEDLFYVSHPSGIERDERLQEIVNTYGSYEKALLCAKENVLKCRECELRYIQLMKENERYLENGEVCDFLDVWERIPADRKILN